MSTPVDVLPPGVTLFGGLPLYDQDFAASIVFAAAYALMLPLIGLRVVKKETRHWIMFKPALFCAVRIATFALRATQANGNYSIGIFIAEQILILSGGLMLIEPCVQLVEMHIGPLAKKDSQESLPILIKVLRLMRVALIVALVLGIYAGTNYNANMSASDISDVHSYRVAASGIGVGVTGTLAVLSIACLVFGRNLSRSGTAWLLVASFFELLQSAYKLWVVEHTESPVALGTKLEYYLLSALPEFIVLLMFVFAPLPKLFPGLLDPRLSVLASIKQRFGIGQPHAYDTHSGGYSGYADQQLQYSPQTRPMAPMSQHSYQSEPVKERV